MVDSLKNFDGAVPEGELAMILTLDRENLTNLRKGWNRENYTGG
jgi:hypothetical protein